MSDTDWMAERDVLCGRSDANIYKEYEATPAATLEQHITDPNIPKSETEWWASREIEKLRYENERLREALRPFLTRAPDTANPDDYDWLMVKAEDIRDARKALGETE